MNSPPANTPPANPPPTGTSPTKAHRHTKSDTRPERSLAAHEGRDVVSVDTFQAIFLNFPNVKLMTKIAHEVSALVSKVTGAEDQASGYQAIPALFNQITELLAKQTSYGSNIHFSHSPTQHPHHHPCGNSDTPDFLAMLQDVYDKLRFVKPCWHYLVSLGEWKSGNTFTDDELSQTGAYAGSLNQARPDNPSGLVFSACRGCYVIGYSDPSTWTMSEPVQWNNLVPLIGYIHSLHVPRLELQDTTITLANPGISQSPRWTIHDDAFNINDTFETIHVGRPHSRMTTIFRRVGDFQNPLIVKDSWVNILRKPELSLFQSLTADGDAPGWVKTRLPAEVVDRLQTQERANVVRRRKDRIVMENTGLAFNQCERLSDAIAAAYDVLETDRWAITKRRILHRDLSPANILIHPVVPSDPRDGAYFIRAVLDPNATQVSSALLLDLDNGTTLPLKHHSLDEIDVLSKDSTQNLRALSGTPMYIARGPSKGYYEDVLRYHFPIFPTLHAAISKGYTGAYQDDSLRAANGLVGTLNEEYHQRCVETRVIQRPWHDAESIMLTLLMFLLRCSPEGSSKESHDDLRRMQHIYNLIRNDGIGSVPDQRDALLMAGLTQWKLYLHKDLHYLAQPVSDICAAVYPDYEFLRPTSNDINVEVVLHEVLQRILLNLYYKITMTSPDLDVKFSKNLRPLEMGPSRKQVFLPVTESKSLYALAGTSYVAGPSRAYVAGTSEAGTSAIRTGGKRQRKRGEDSGERKPPAKKKRKQDFPMNVPLRRSQRLRKMRHEIGSPELQPVAMDEAPQPNIELHGPPEPEPAVTECDIDRYPPEVEPVVMDTPQHDIEDDSDGSPGPARFTKEEKGKAPQRGQ